jgi:tryptophan 7-halogenase
VNATTGNGAVQGLSDRHIRKVVIVGGGTSGWMTAARLSILTHREPCRIVLVESDDVGTVGVGESTLPSMRDFNQALGIDENEFVSKTHATFKLGIEFVDWTRVGHSYFGPLGSQGFSAEEQGTQIELPSLYKYLLQLVVDGSEPDFDEYSMCCAAARENRFDRPKNVPDAIYSYAYQLDASLYAKYLRKYAEHRGVERIEGRIVDVPLRGENGFIDAVVLQSGQRIEGDLFIDCSGFHALLIGKVLNVPYIDWTHWLPCDRAWAVPCERTGALTPYTQAIAREAGWQWRIPLQHRIGNGYVFSSKFTTEERAREVFLSHLEGRPQAEPRLVKFAAGRREKAWIRNCVAIGLSSGFIEPLESTSIQFISVYLNHLVRQFPDKDCSPLLTEDFNRRVAPGVDAIRDFITLHYKATEREDTDFWRYCKYMSIPDSLALKIEMFRKYGRFSINPVDGFGVRPWLTVMYGQGIVPQSCSPVTALDDSAMRAELAKVRAGIKRAIEIMPRHEDFIARNCRAPALAS